MTEIDWIEAAGVYVNLHLGNRELLYRAALAELAERLDPARFIRVHRSTIVNLERVAKIEPYAKDSRVAVLSDGTQLPVSRAGYDRLKALLGEKL